MRSDIFFPVLATLSVAIPVSQDLKSDSFTTVGLSPNTSLAKKIPAGADKRETTPEERSSNDPIFAYTAPQWDEIVEKQAGNCATHALEVDGASGIDSPSAFQAYSGFASAAASAPSPSGYLQTFSNQAASSNANGFMGYVTLPAYDTSLCAEGCNARMGCAAFNIYFERQSGSVFNESCADPPSVSIIKCVFWGGPVTEDNILNTGHKHSRFHAIIAGSNGYVNQTVDAADGYSPATFLGTASIDAPQDCFGHDTYVGFKFWSDGRAFDSHRCAAVCDAQNEYNIAHPSADGTPLKFCNFFNTYLLLKNDIVQGQTCSLYTKTWDKSYATYRGYRVGSDRYSISHSYSFTHQTDRGGFSLACKK